MPQKQKTILVVEDDVTMREIVVQKLRSEGYNVLEAEHGKKGVKLATKEKPHVILLDLMLPEMDGFEVLSYIRNHQDKTVTEIPIIILTNLWSKDDVVKTKKMGVSAYIIKAYMTTEEIVEKVEEVLKSTADGKEEQKKASQKNK
jgi:DNA-binding response OmpR family regulator